MPGQLAGKIRAKYPGVYDDIDDAALEKQVLAKYPQYADMAKPEQTAPEGKSVGGFLSNVVSSGGRFIADTVKGLPALGGAIRTGAQIVQGDPLAAQRAASAVPQAASALGSHYKERYGGLSNLANTAYEDPVGVMADVSTVFGGGAATVPGRGGRLLTRLSNATNPAALIAKPAAKATEYTAAAMVRPALNPSKRLRLQQRSPLEIERTTLKGGFLTSGQAKGAVKRASAETTRKAQEAEATGVVAKRQDVAQFPRTLDEVENLTPNVSEMDQLARLESETMATLPENISPTELLKRRRALDRKLNKAFRAEERGGPPTGITETGQQELVGRMREQFRTAVPGARASDDAARRFGLSREALSDAANRPSRLTTLLAGGGAGAAAATGNLPAAAGAALIGTGLQYPQVPLAMGIPPVLLSQMAATEPAVRAALLSRLLAEKE